MNPRARRLRKHRRRARKFFAALEIAKKSVFRKYSEIFCAAVRPSDFVPEKS